MTQAHKNIYDQHRAAFSNVSAYVVLKDGERVATIAFKYPKDGAGRLQVYIHYIGLEMVKSYAGGYGYDKASAAVESAVKKIKGGECRDKKLELDASDFVGLFQDIGGKDWSDVLRDAGFTVLSAV